MAPSTVETLRVQREEDALTLKQAFARDVLEGLSASPKTLCDNPQWFYDDEGSRIYEKIVDLPEYYPPEREKEILEEHAADLADAFFPGPMNVVDLGVGDGRRTRILLDALLAAHLDFQFVPIDISAGAIQDLVRNMDVQYPQVHTHALVAEYFDGLNWLKKNSASKTAVLFLGGNIGNLTPEKQLTYLWQMRDALNPGDLALIGFDLKKDPSIMVPAYFDSQGVTSEFNYNLLKRINSELGGHFDVSLFKHEARWNEKICAMESHLVSTKDQVVAVDALNETFHFQSGESIHTEYSFKYTVDQIHGMAKETGFRVVRDFLCSKKWFVDSLWQAV